MAGSENVRKHVHRKATEWEFCGSGHRTAQPRTMPNLPSGPESPEMSAISRHSLSRAPRTAEKEGGSSANIQIVFPPAQVSACKSTGFSDSTGGMMRKKAESSWRKLEYPPRKSSSNPLICSAGGIIRTADSSTVAVPVLRTVKNLFPGKCQQPEKDQAPDILVKRTLQENEKQQKSHPADQLPTESLRAYPELEGQTTAARTSRPR